MIQGQCDGRFAEVREQFERNFAERGELGASVCVTVDGEPVVDLWGGTRDEATGDPWQADTVNVVMSCSKGVAALCGNMVLERGQLDLDEPVARYWPEFAANGKDSVLVRHVFTHQSGVAHVTDEVPEGGLCDWPTWVRLMERTTPYWEPGTRVGYHAMTIGNLIGELLRRVDGRSIGTFLREEVTEPLGVDCWMGLPEEHEHRVAPSIPFDLDAPGVPPELVEAAKNPAPIMRAVLFNNGNWFFNWDTREAHAGELPSCGMITNGRGLAGVYTPLANGGAIDGVRLVRAETIAGMRYARACTDVDVTLGNQTAYTLGFSKSWMGGTHPSGIGGNGVTIGEDAFGTPGLGGQVGFADPHHRMAFGYTMNRHGTGTGLNARGQSLVDATYRALGCTTDAPGFWARP